VNASASAVSPSARPLQALAVAARFPGSRDQVHQARGFAARVLDGWPAVNDVVFCVSELAANAVVHSASGRAGGIFWVHVTAVPGEYVRVDVCDQGGRWVRRDPDGERPHGLDIVRLLAASFGVDGDACSGRIVWARLDLSEVSGIPAAISQAPGAELTVPEPARSAVNGHSGHAYGRSSWRA